MMNNRPGPAPKHRESPLMERATILIVEDDDAIATGLALNLRLAGHEPITACDGEKALSTIEAGGLNLVLLDINQPKKDGLGRIGATPPRRKPNPSHCPFGPRGRIRQSRRFATGGQTTT